jgi:hypothetical protein
MNEYQQPGCRPRRKEEGREDGSLSLPSPLDDVIIRICNFEFLKRGREGKKRRKRKEEEKEKKGERVSTPQKKYKEECSLEPNGACFPWWPQPWGGFRLPRPRFRLSRRVWALEARFAPLPLFLCWALLFLPLCRWVWAKVHILTSERNKEEQRPVGAILLLGRGRTCRRGGLGLCRSSLCFWC